MEDKRNSPQTNQKGIPNVKTPKNYANSLINNNSLVKVDQKHSEIKRKNPSPIQKNSERHNIRNSNQNKNYQLKTHHPENNNSKYDLKSYNNSRSNKKKDINKNYKKTNSVDYGIFPRNFSFIETIYSKYGFYNDDDFLRYGIYTYRIDVGSRNIRYYSNGKYKKKRERNTYSGSYGYNKYSSLSYDESNKRDKRIARIEYKEHRLKKSDSNDKKMNKTMYTPFYDTVNSEYKSIIKQKNNNASSQNKLSASDNKRLPRNKTSSYLKQTNYNSNINSTISINRRNNNKNESNSKQEVKYTKLNQKNNIINKDIKDNNKKNNIVQSVNIYSPQKEQTNGKRSTHEKTNLSNIKENKNINEVRYNEQKLRERKNIIKIEKIETKGEEKGKSDINKLKNVSILTSSKENDKNNTYIRQRAEINNSKIINKRDNGVHHTEKEISKINQKNYIIEGTGKPDISMLKEFFSVKTSNEENKFNKTHIKQRSEINNSKIINKRDNSVHHTEKDISIINQKKYIIEGTGKPDINMLKEFFSNIPSTEDNKFNKTHIKQRTELNKTLQNKNPIKIDANNKSMRGSSSHMMKIIENINKKEYIIEGTGKVDIDKLNEFFAINALIEKNEKIKNMPHIRNRTQIIDQNHNINGNILKINTNRNINQKENAIKRSENSQSKNQKENNTIILNRTEAKKQNKTNYINRAKGIENLSQILKRTEIINKIQNQNTNTINAQIRNSRPNQSPNKKEIQIVNHRNQNNDRKIIKVAINKQFNENKNVNQKNLIDKNLYNNNTYHNKRSKNSENNITIKNINQKNSNNTSKNTSTNKEHIISIKNINVNRQYNTSNPDQKNTITNIIQKNSRANMVQKNTSTNISQRDSRTNINQKNVSTNINKNNPRTNVIQKNNTSDVIQKNTSTNVTKNNNISNINLKNTNTNINQKYSITNITSIKYTNSRSTRNINSKNIIQKNDIIDDKKDLVKNTIINNNNSKYNTNTNYKTSNNNSKYNTNTNNIKTNNNTRIISNRVSTTKDKEMKSSLSNNNMVNVINMKKIEKNLPQKNDYNKLNKEGLNIKKEKTKTEDNDSNIVCCSKILVAKNKKTSDNSLLSSQGYKYNNNTYNINKNDLNNTNKKNENSKKESKIIESKTYSNTFYQRNQNSNIRKNEIINTTSNSYIKSCEGINIGGKNKNRANKVNQETYFIEKNINGINNFNIFGVLDIHNKNAQSQNKLTKGFIIDQIKNHPLIKNEKDAIKIYSTLKSNNYKILSNIFFEANKLNFMQQFDKKTKRSTYIILVQILDHIISVNAGDSKAILIYDKDHNDEKLLESKIHQLTEVFQPDDNTKKVISISQIVEYNINKSNKYFVIGSPEFWRIISNDECMKIGNEYYLKNDSLGLCKEFYRKITTIKYVNDFNLDDISIIVGFF